MRNNTNHENAFKNILKKIISEVTCLIMSNKDKMNANDLDLTFETMFNIDGEEFEFSLENPVYMLFQEDGRKTQLVTKKIITHNWEQHKKDRLEKKEVNITTMNMFRANATILYLKDEEREFLIRFSIELKKIEGLATKGQNEYNPFHLINSFLTNLMEYFNKVDGLYRLEIIEHFSRELIDLNTNEPNVKAYSSFYLGELYEQNRCWLENSSLTETSISYNYLLQYESLKYYVNAHRFSSNRELKAEALDCLIRLSDKINESFSLSKEEELKIPFLANAICANIYLGNIPSGNNHSAASRRDKIYSSITYYMRALKFCETKAYSHKRVDIIKKIYTLIKVSGQFHISVIESYDLLLVLNEYYYSSKNIQSPEIFWKLVCITTKDALKNKSPCTNIELAKKKQKALSLFLIYYSNNSSSRENTDTFIDVIKELLGEIFSACENIDLVKYKFFSELLLDVKFCGLNDNSLKLIDNVLPIEKRDQLLLLELKHFPTSSCSREGEANGASKKTLLDYMFHHKNIPLKTHRHEYEKYLKLMLVLLNDLFYAPDINVTQENSAMIADLGAIIEVELSEVDDCELPYILENASICNYSVNDEELKLMHNEYANNKEHPEDIGFYFWRQISHFCLADFFIDQGQYEKSEKYIDNAINIDSAHKTNDLDFVGSVGLKAINSGAGNGISSGKKCLSYFIKNSTQEAAGQLLFDLSIGILKYTHNLNQQGPIELDLINLLSELIVYARETRKININAVKDRLNNTILHWASYYNSIAMVDLLINSDSDTSTCGNLSLKPLFWAAINNNHSMLEKLKNGANINNDDKIIFEKYLAREKVDKASTLYYNIFPKVELSLLKSDIKPLENNQSLQNQGSRSANAHSSSSEPIMSYSTESQSSAKEEYYSGICDNFREVLENNNDLKLHRLAFATKKQGYNILNILIATGEMALLERFLSKHYNPNSKLLTKEDKINKRYDPLQVAILFTREDLPKNFQSNFDSESLERAVSSLVDKDVDITDEMISFIDNFIGSCKDQKTRPKRSHDPINAISLCQDKNANKDMLGVSTNNNKITAKSRGKRKAKVGVVSRQAKVARPMEGTELFKHQSHEEEIILSSSIYKISSFLSEFARDFRRRVNEIYSYAPPYTDDKKYAIVICIPKSMEHYIKSPGSLLDINLTAIDFSDYDQWKLPMLNNLCSRAGECFTGLYLNKERILWQKKRYNNHFNPVYYTNAIDGVCFSSQTKFEQHLKDQASSIDENILPALLMMRSFVFCHPLVALMQQEKASDQGGNEYTHDDESISTIIKKLIDTDKDQFNKIMTMRFGPSALNPFAHLLAYCNIDRALLLLDLIPDKTIRREVVMQQDSQGRSALFYWAKTASNVPAIELDKARVPNMSIFEERFGVPIGELMSSKEQNGRSLLSAIADESYDKELINSITTIDNNFHPSRGIHI